MDKRNKKGVGDFDEVKQRLRRAPKRQRGASIPNGPAQMLWEGGLAAYEKLKRAGVAAQGHPHLQVRKETAAQTTVTHIRPLHAKERVQEVARMLGGVEITRQTLELAAEMLSRVGEAADVPA